MNLQIQERKFSLRSEYDISTPDCNYYAKKEIFSFRDKLQILNEERRILARINGRFSFFRSKYDFLFSDGRSYRFWCEKIWKGVIRCEGSEESFHLYKHKGLSYSIFRHDRQIAAVTKNRVVIGGGNEYEILIDQDANVLAVICMVLTINTSENEDNETVTYDFGNVGPEGRPVDRTWEPR